MTYDNVYMKPELKIFKIQNGFILEYPDYDVDGDEPKQKYMGYTLNDDVYNENDVRKLECENYRYLLYSILDVLGYVSSDHKKYNIYIKIEEDEEL